MQTMARASGRGPLPVVGRATVSVGGTGSHSRASSTNSFRQNSMASSGVRTIGVSSIIDVPSSGLHCDEAASAKWPLPRYHGK
jgi:hypothetical protein